MLKLAALLSMLALSACVPPAATPDVLDATAVEASTVDASAEVTSDEPAPRPDGELPMDARVDF